MELHGRHWCAAFAIAVALHLLVAGVWLWQAPPSGAVSTGTGGISVSLGPAGSAPGTVTQESDATTDAEPVRESEIAEEVPTETVEVPETETQEVTPPEPEAVRPPEPEVAEAAEVPVQQNAEPPVEQPKEPVAEPLLEPLDAQVAEAEPLAEPITEPVEEPEVAEAVEPETPEARAEPVETASAVVPPPPPKPRDLPEAPQPAKRPEPKPAPEAEPAEQVAAAPKGPPAPASKAVAGSGGKSGTKAAPDVGSAQSQSGGGQAGASPDYQALLLAWLEKHKEYPRRARMRRQEGTALLFVVIDRDGNVLDHRIERSSGHGLLDEEVEEMIERANPVPPMPEDMQQATLDLLIPVVFNMKD